MVGIVAVDSFNKPAILEAKRREILQQIPLGRFGSVEVIYNSNCNVTPSSGNCLDSMVFGQ